MSHTAFARLPAAAMTLSVLAASALATAPASAGGGYQSGGYHGTGGWHYITPRPRYIPFPLKVFSARPLYNPRRGRTVLK